MKDFHTRKLLKEKFGFEGGYWFPLTGDQQPENCEYFDEDIFIKDYSLERLILLIKRLGCGIINEIAESFEDSKIAIDDLGSYCGLEVIYCNDEVEWAIYFSHENTVTFFGAQLLKNLKSDWSSWERNKDPWMKANIA